MAGATRASNKNVTEGKKTTTKGPNPLGLLYDAVEKLGGVATVAQLMRVVAEKGFSLADVQTAAIFWVRLDSMKLEGTKLILFWLSFA